MSFFSQQLPQWNNSGTEPNGAKKTAGWLDNEKPPAGWFNWLFNRIYNCLIEIRTVVDGIGVPVGTITYFAASSPPAGYLAANGAAMSRTTYAALYAAVGTVWGVGNGSTTFNIPDGRGWFPRGWDSAGTYDPNRPFGSYQYDGNKAHSHSGTTGTESVPHSHSYYRFVNSGTLGTGSNSPIGNQADVTGPPSATHTHTFSTSTSGNTETTVKNMALLCCVKY
jgi:phage-related tail fiber protein